MCVADKQDFLGSYQILPRLYELGCQVIAPQIGCADVIHTSH